LPVVDGEANGHSNFFDENVTDAAIRRLETTNWGGLVNEDRLLRSLLSSQPVCFNLFGVLQHHPDVLLTWLRSIDIDAAAIEPTDPADRDLVRIEYAPPKKGRPSLLRVRRQLALDHDQGPIAVDDADVRAPGAALQLGHGDGILRHPGDLARIGDEDRLEVCLVRVAVRRGTRPGSLVDRPHEDLSLSAHRGPPSLRSPTVVRPWSVALNNPRSRGSPRKSVEARQPPSCRPRTETAPWAYAVRRGRSGISSSRLPRVHVFV